MAAADFRDRLLAGLGGDWPKPCPLKPKVLQTEQKEGYRVETIRYDAEPGDAIPALLLVPDSATPSRPAPAICIWHQHAGQWHLGKTEPAGLAGNPMHHTGAALAREGYVVLCPDALGFEERAKPYKLQGGNLERYLFLKYVVDGKSMAWKNILDMKRAVDYAVSRPEVQDDHIGCYGHSMGSTHMWLVGPWEPRLKALVGNCCLPTYKGIHDNELLHCFPNFVPGIFPHGDTPDIAALIAPRPLHMNFGETDGGSPIDEVRRGVKVIARAYEAQHAEKNFSYYIEEGSGHVLSDAMWKRTSEFFDRHLRG
ncbi:MAG: alpha/beta hydrolase family protein [Pirellulaceae bacterium]|nr:alpha/beta hydrolase family protein [Pirellulaceae bacterium]